MTTPDPRRPFAGRPARGQVPPPGPGVLVPDAPVVLPGFDRTRLRALARSGFLLLVGSGVDLGSVEVPGQGPVQVLALAEIDPDGTLTSALGARDDEVWVIRPDAHIAAVLAGPTRDGVAAALARATARRERRGLEPARR
ncbi:MAG TPA: hypothetical protein VG674_13045 [Amycolatopsis sp.]|nr:hypothetical protein [Amycolatopsis sp.]